ncbi:MAG TPA: site-2 protease family protein, partial [Anaerolineales bacterium]|nr:site-2 protease family protein [Anaerolineales bacterium]
MRWQWKLGTFAGIDVFVHATFLLLIGWIGYSHWLRYGTIAKVAEGVVFILALFLCVVLHEYGHALTARRYGIKTRDITLYPIGGVARLERLPDKPIEELWVALMGPAVNVVIAALLFVYLYLTGGLVPMTDLTVASGSFLARLMAVNVSLVLFNLIPAFPMDGGRVLRALLAMRMDYVRATQIAANIGQGLAFLLGLFGLFNNPFLLFIAFFVWIGASQEASMVQMRNSISGIPVTHAMQTRFDILTPSDRLDRVVSLILAGSQQDFPVVEDGQFVGVVTRDDFIRALSQKGENTPVMDVIRRNVPTVDSHEMVEMALTRLQESGSKTLPV